MMWLTFYFLFFSSDLHLKEHTGYYMQKGWRRRALSQTGNMKTNEKVIHQRADGGLDWGKLLDLEIRTKNLMETSTGWHLYHPTPTNSCKGAVVHKSSAVNPPSLKAGSSFQRPGTMRLPPSNWAQEIWSLTTIHLSPDVCYSKQKQPMNKQQTALLVLSILSQP